MNEIVDAWIATFSSQDSSRASGPRIQASEILLDWSIEGDAESLWQFISVAYKRDIDDNVLAVLAAGPLEDLLAHHGGEYIDRVEELARSDPKFNFLLGGVWQNSMTEEIWHRVQAIRDRVW